MKKIAFVASSPLSLKLFMNSYISDLSYLNHVFVIADFDGINESRLFKPGIKIISVTIKRQPNFIWDIIALINLMHFFYFNKIHSVHSVTPKAGLLSMIAALICRVPHRIHTFTGQVWVTKTSFGRMFYKFLDRIISSAATEILVDSPSQLDFLIKENVVSKAKAEVIGNGSISGVDTNKFRPNYEKRNKIREMYEIPLDAFVFIYLGRLNREKGIFDLANALVELDNFLHKKIYVVMVGSDEGEIWPRVLGRINSQLISLRWINHVEDPQNILLIADVLLLPSHREGFGNVIIEAGACEIPSIGTNIYGISDAIQNNVTGMLFKPGDFHALAFIMNQFISNPSLVREMGVSSRIRVLNLFKSEDVSREVLNFYKSRILSE